MQADGDGGRVSLPLEVMKLDRAGGSERANLKCLKKYVTGRDHRLTTQELGWHVHVYITSCRALEVKPTERAEPVLLGLSATMLRCKLAR